MRRIQNKRSPTNQVKKIYNNLDRIGIIAEIFVLARSIAEGKIKHFRVCDRDIHVSGI